jgi:thiol-disulfide isomerase/thioredoxin
MWAQRGRALLAAVPIALLWFGVHGGDTDSRRAAVGRPVPEYRAVSLDGDPASLGALRGRAVLLNVWSVWCTPCRAEVPVLDGLYRTYRTAGLEMIGVNVDPRGDESTVRTYVRAAGMTYPVWRDPEDAIAARFPAAGVPRSYLIGRDGTLLWEHLGMIRRDDPGLRRAVQDALGQRWPDAAVVSDVRVSSSASRIVATRIAGTRHARHLLDERQARSMLL